MAKPNLNTQNSNSKALFELAKQIIPGGVNSPVRAYEPYPFYTKYAQGSKLTDEDNNTYTDYCNAYGALLLGHTNPQIIDAATKQLTKGTLYGTPTKQEIKLTQKIQTTTPTMQMIRLVNSGTEATMHTIRTARAYTNKNKIIKLEGNYHGAHDTLLVQAGSATTTHSTPTSPGIPPQTTQNTITLPYNNTEKLEQTIKEQANQIAALIIEPIMANAGLILPQKNYLQQVRKLTAQNNIVLIFDEIITGYRVSIGGAQQHYNIEPDMTTLGKVLGGGFPIAAFGGKKQIMQNISPQGKTYQAGTYNANPISTTTANTTLNILTQNQNTIYPQLEKNCQELTKALKDYSENYHLETQVYNIASMFQIFFSSQPVTDMASAKQSDTKKFQTYFKELLKQGIFIPPSQFECCFISTAHTKKDLQQTIEAFDKALHTVVNVN
jgi:glutamate-1-semialdehyde 2,1-aminomutase